MWQELREELHPKGLEVVTVALDVGGPEACVKYVDAASPAHPSLLDQAHVLDELLGVVNVPNGVWVDEEGMVVRPAEPAFPGRNPVMESFASIDTSTLAPDVADMITEVKKIRTDPDAYKAALLDWVDRGADSPYALSADEVVARSQPRSMDQADHAGAIVHWREAHRLFPDNWTYKRQAWNFEDPVRQGPTDKYDSCWIDDVKAIGAENYYPAVTF